MESRGIGAAVVIAIVVVIVAVATIGGYYLLAREKGPISENEAVKMAIEGLEYHRLFVTEPYKHLLDNTVPGEPIFVESIDNGSPKFPNYYLVPFVRNGRTWVIVVVNAEVGGFMEARNSENGLAKYPMVSSEEAFEIVRKAIKNIGPLQNAKLVWKPCEQSWAPVLPFWAVQADGKTVYVGQDGQLYEELTRGGLMGG